MRRYIQRHAWGHASGDDFLAALGTQDPALPAALRSFTAQPGIPRVAVALQCDEGQPPRLTLAQSRLLGLATPVTGAAPLWQVPMLIRTPGGNTRVMLDQRESSLTLPDAQCPAWVQANAGGIGYYRVAYSPALRRALLAQPGLTAGEALSLLDDAEGLSEAGDLPLVEMLAMAEHFAGHADHTVVEQAAGMLARARKLQGGGTVADAAARWQRAFGDRARALGWQARPDEPQDAPLLRALLVPLVADQGEDAQLRRQARERAQAWLDGGPAPETATRAALLASAALDGDEALFDALRAAARSATDRSLRRDLYAALGHFRAPRLAQRARELMLDPATDFREAGDAVMHAHNQLPALRDGLLQFLQDHYAEITRRMGRDEPAGLPTRVSQACSAEEARRIDRLFGPVAAKYQGGRRALAQTLEQVQVCAAWRSREATRQAARSEAAQPLN